MEDGQPSPREWVRGCRASWCTQNADNNMLSSRFSSSPEGISLLKVILLETRHSCSGLRCLLQPSKVCKAICCLILCSLAIYQVSVQRGNRLSCARMADKHQPFCWPTRGPESIIIIWNYILHYLVIHHTLVIIAAVHLHFQVWTAEILIGSHAQTKQQHHRAIYKCPILTARVPGRVWCCLFDWHNASVNYIFKMLDIHLVIFRRKWGVWSNWRVPKDSQVTNQLEQPDKNVSLGL